MAHPSRLIERANALRTTGMSWSDAAEFVSAEFADEMRQPISGDSLRHACRRYIPNGAVKTSGTVTSHTATADTVDRIAEVLRHSERNPENMTTVQWFNAFRAAAEPREAISITEYIANVEVPTKGPIAVTFSSDWHIGSPYVEYDALQHDLNIIKKDGRFYLCVGGDPIDNFQVGFKDAQAPMNALHPPQIQRLALETILKELEPSILAMIGGNHNQMSIKRNGEDGDYYILRGFGFSYLPFGGLLKIKVGDMLYKFIWKHKYKGGGAKDKFNSHRRMIEELAPEAHCAVTEHFHDPGTQQIETGEYDSKRTQIHLRTGSYKGQDPFSMDGFKGGRIGSQVIVLWPDQMKLGPVFHGVDALIDAQIYLNGRKDVSYD